MAGQGKLVGTDMALYAAKLPAGEIVPWDQLVSFGRKLEHMPRWALGDIACYIAATAEYGDATLERYAAEVGLEYSTLRDYRQVSEAFPAGSVARATHPWTVYRTFAALDDRYQLVARPERWTVAAARALVGAGKGTGEPEPVAAADGEHVHRWVCKDCGEPRP